MSNPAERLAQALLELSNQVIDRQERIQREEWAFQQHVAELQAEIERRYLQEKEQWERAIREDDLTEQRRLRGQ